MFFKAKVLLWPILLVIVLFLAATVAAFGFGGMNALALGPLFGSNTEERNSQLVQSVKQQEEVALVSLGIEGIVDRAESGTVFGMAIPGTERVTFIRYAFEAKLGIDGGDVDIEQTGENSFTVSIPAFVFIGYDEPSFEVAAENNGVLSWTTPGIDTLEMVNRILDAEEQRDYLAKYEETLTASARDFYSRLIASVDPAITVEFEFAK